MLNAFFILSYGNHKDIQASKFFYNQMDQRGLMQSLLEHTSISAFLFMLSLLGLYLLVGKREVVLHLNRFVGWIGPDFPPSVKHSHFDLLSSHYQEFGRKVLQSVVLLIVSWAVLEDNWVKICIWLTGNSISNSLPDSGIPSLLNCHGFLYCFFSSILQFTTSLRWGSGGPPFNYWW